MRFSHYFRASRRDMKAPQKKWAVGSGQWAVLIASLPTAHYPLPTFIVPLLQPHLNCRRVSTTRGFEGRFEFIYLTPSGSGPRQPRVRRRDGSSGRRGGRSADREWPSRWGPPPAEGCAAGPCTP